VSEETSGNNRLSAEPDYWAQFEIMDVNRTSVFELTPSDRLRLGEDLWDDLAATPDAVPLYGWQKAQLARRKANLRKNPASGLPWQKVQRRVRSQCGR
jgi:putative addiction module component (TIGR02574 family)